MSELTPGIRRLGDRCYAGVIRHGRNIVVECGHKHTNRDESSKTNGVSARDCATRILTGARRPAAAEEYAARYRNAWRPTGAGFEVGRTTLERWKIRAEEDATRYEQNVAAVAALLAEPRAV